MVYQPNVARGFVGSLHHIYTRIANYRSMTICAALIIKVAALFTWGIGMIVASFLSHPTSPPFFMIIFITAPTSKQQSSDSKPKISIALAEEILKETGSPVTDDQVVSQLANNLEQFAFRLIHP